MSASRRYTLAELRRLPPIVHNGGADLKIEDVHRCGHGVRVWLYDTPDLCMATVETRNSHPGVPDSHRWVQTDVYRLDLAQPEPTPTAPNTAGVELTLLTDSYMATWPVNSEYLNVYDSAADWAAGNDPTATLAVPVGTPFAAEAFAALIGAVTGRHASDKSTPDHAPTAAPTPDELTVDGIRFDNVQSRDRYVALKELDELHLLYLARSDGYQLKRRSDPTYLSVADEHTNPEWVTSIAARVALTKGWIDAHEHDILTR